MGGTMHINDIIVARVGGTAGLSFYTHALSSDEVYELKSQDKWK